LQEGDIVAILESNDEPKIYMVQRTEDVVADYTFTTAIGTLTIGQSEQVETLEPKQTEGVEKFMYQLRCGVDVGNIYAEINAGSYRRTPYRNKKPSTTTPYVGYFNGYSSPFGDPQFELWTRYNERPAFSCYNPWGFSITPKLHFAGKKLRMYELCKDSADFLHMDANRILSLREAVLSRNITHRRITPYGVDDS
jgi:hypothetical protein